jgi:hypothetical protein
MGSHNRWRIDVNTNDENTIQEIKDFGVSKDNDKTTTWYGFAFRKWCEHTKWDPVDLLISISKNFPKLIFSAAYSGDYGTGKVFIFNGKTIEASEIWINPPFPNLVLLRKSLVSKEKRDAAKKLAENQAREAKEIAAKEARIKALESELEALKQEKKPLATMDLSWQHG